MLKVEILAALQSYLATLCITGLCSIEFSFKVIKTIVTCLREMRHALKHLIKNREGKKFFKSAELIDKGIILKRDVKAGESLLNALVWFRLKSTGGLLR